VITTEGRKVGIKKALFFSARFSNLQAGRLVIKISLQFCMHAKNPLIKFAFSREKLLQDHWLCLCSPCLAIDLRSDLYNIGLLSSS
jgi:hypothetical protein